MMLYFGCFCFSSRAGDLLGTWIYDNHGGFIPTVILTTLVCALILPVLLLVPKRLTATKDGESIEGNGSPSSSPRSTES
jgi:hypothetical protein